MTILVAWSPIALLGAVTLPSRWLNTRSAIIGRMAEKLGWMSFATAVATLCMWSATDSSSYTAALTQYGIIGIRLDKLSLAMACLVTFLGVVILRYSRNYLAGDRNQGHFFKWMLVTLGAVLSICLAPGLVQFWLSWVVCSLGLHHLLAYYPERLGTLLSARKKFTVSRLGDLSLILAFIGMFNHFGTQNFGELFAMVAAHPELMASNSWIGWLLIAGAALKSAQFPFHTWLPDTMGTPTPVSALMHAGIINAGGYLVIRMSPLLVHAPAALHMLAVVGAITLTGASLVMLTQTSIKRSLAYSTIAQMGFMLLQCGLGAFSLATLHLVAHSLYKANAFLSSGSSVATLKRLESRPATSFNRISFITYAAVFLCLSTVIITAFGPHPTGKPGILVLGVVLALALTQFLATRMQQGKSIAGKFIIAGKAVSIGLLYVGLARLSTAYFSSTLPDQPIIGMAVQAGMACFLAIFLGFTILVLRYQEKLKSQATFRAIYIHALNGFYLNTIANRFARTVGLVPAGR